jgi:hypothetical protein
LTKKQNTKTGLFFGTIIFGGLGIFLLFTWVQNLQMARSSKSWPAVQGTVVSSKVVRVLDSTDKNGKRHYIYKGLVKYSYTVEGQNHLSTRISFGDYSTSRAGHAEKIVANYPIGKQVRVYYDPDFPVQAVLERKAGFGHFIPALVGFLFLLGGIAMLFAFFAKLFTGR